MKPLLLKCLMVALIACLFLWPGSAQEPKRDNARYHDLAKAKFDIASNVYREYIALENSGSASNPEFYHRWAKNLLDSHLELCTTAKDRLQAYQDHYDRTKVRTEKQYKALNQTKSNRNTREFDYHLLEAEMLLERAKDEVLGTGNKK